MVLFMTKRRRRRAKDESHRAVNILFYRLQFHICDTNV